MSNIVEGYGPLPRVPGPESHQRRPGQTNVEAAKEIRALEELERKALASVAENSEEKPQSRGRKAR